MNIKDIVPGRKYKHTTHGVVTVFSVYRCVTGQDRIDVRRDLNGTLTEPCYDPGYLSEYDEVEEKARELWGVWRSAAPSSWVGYDDLCRESPPHKAVLALARHVLGLEDKRES